MVKPQMRKWEQMAKQNQHIEEYLDAYREMKDADFAVMIAGQWGCGKTHFIKGYLKGKEVIYVSLNGLSDTAGVDLAIFKELFPLAGKKPVGIAIKFIKEGLRAGLNFNLSEALSISDFKSKIGGKLLVFDDLERCLLKPEAVLGYINSFIEHGDAKVVIIGEEDHLNKGSDEKYRVIKEKVVGKTFRLTERIEEIFDDLVAEKSYPKTFEIIRRNKAIVINLFQKVDKETKKHNYRALKHCLRDFEYFYPRIGQQFCGNTEFLDTLFKVFVALDYEMQLGHFPISELKARNTAAYYVAIMRKDNDSKPQRTNYENVLERHGFEINPIMAQNDLIFFENLWGRILGSEQIGTQEIEEVIQNSSYFISKSQPEWVTLWHWRHIEDIDAETALAVVHEKLKKHEYESYAVVMHVFSILMGLSEHGAILKTKDDILKSARKYLDEIVDQGRFLPPEGRLGWHWTNSGSHGLGYWATGDDFKQLVNLIDAAIEKTVEKNRAGSVELWMKQLSDFPGEFYPKIDINGEYCREPVMSLFDVDQFIAAIAKIPNESKWMVSKLFKNRYEYHGKELSEELSFVESVISALDERIISATKDGKAVTPSTINMKDMRSEFEQARALLRSAAAQ